MKNNLAKKYSVLCVLAIYVLAYFLQSFSFFDFGIILDKTYAEDQLDYTNLVAVFVDDKIYDDIKDDVKRYAQTYIQGDNSNNRYNSISNSKAIVMPIDTENVSATDITKILENMYFDGISGEPSKLVWTVLIWDIPLPVVNQDGFIYPTIYPYVDFKEQKFIWDEKVWYFVYNDNPNGQAEIWHGIINFDEIEEYQNYFDKLRKYSNDPSKFIGKNIWYDDLIANKHYFYKEALGSYINNFLFAEDLGYHRYSDLMVKIMQESHNDMISELLSGFDGADELQKATESMNTPTMTLKKMIEEWYLKSYTSLIWGKQLDNIITNVETANRWIEQYTWSDGKSKSRTALDTHYLKMEEKDETLLRLNGWVEPLMISFNNALEDILNDKIEQEKYWMNEVIPLTYLKYDGDKKFDIKKPWKFKYVWKDYSAFENYFFGIDAKNLNNMQDTSTYRGTYRNFDDIHGLTIDDIQSSDYPSSDIDDEIDLNKKTVWWSYDIFATQVDANRWYNITNTVNELEKYKIKKIAQREYWNTKCDKKFLGICWVKRRRESDQSPTDHLCNPGNTEEEWWCEMPADFAIRNRGWASPLNLSGMDERTISYNFQDAIMPVFDIAGSKQLENEEPAANSFEWVKEYSRLIQKTFVPKKKKYWTKNADRLEPDLRWKWYNSAMGEDMKFTNRMPLWNLDNPTWIYTEPKRASSVDYFDKYDSSAHWENDIIKITKETDNNEIWKWEIFTYRTLDSRVKNNKSTSDDVNWSSFLVFQDPQSPSKIMYKWILDKIDRTSDSLDINKKTISDWNDWGIKKNISKLWSLTEQVNNNFDKITTYNINTLSNLSSDEIQSLANNWNNTYVESDRNKINDKAEEIKDQFVDLNGFVNNFTFDEISEYIQSELYKFDINKRDLIFLSTWKNTIQTKLRAIKNLFYTMDDSFGDIENQYNNIKKLPNNLITILSNKKSNINDLIVDPDGNGIACQDEYIKLCDAIDTMIANITDYDVNDTIEKISNFEYWDEDVTGNSIEVNIKPFVDIVDNINNSSISSENASILLEINWFESSTDPWLTHDTPGMNMTTSDRPIDSPKYITFKWVGGNKVTFIYPDLYKAEVFNGDSNILNLKDPENISNSIKNYLRKTVRKYNEYLTEQQNKKANFYSQNSSAYDLLAQNDELATPNRNYNLMDDDFLIDELESRLKNSVFFSGQMGWYEPIEFISHILYYQNIARDQKEIWETILDDIDNARNNFNINKKITHIVDNYLIKDNNKWNFITPGYRDNGYEVAFINSDGADYITYKDNPAFIQRVKSAVDNFEQENSVNIEQTQLEEEIQNECNIPEDGAVMLFDLQEWWSPWLKAVRCWWEKIREKPFEFDFDWSTSKWPVIHFETDGKSDGTMWIVWDGWINDLGNDMYQQTQAQYMNQLDLLDLDDENKEVLENMDNSNPGDYQKLEKILSYVTLEINNQNINADTASGNINVSSSIALWNVEFYVQNIWDSIISLWDDEWNNISNNISLWTENYSTGKFNMEPFDGKLLNFKIDNPIDWTNVIVFHMCLPGTQNIYNCVKKSLRLNVIPGAIKKISIETPGDKVLEKSRIPISVKWVDTFGNNVWQLLLDRFDISASTGSISYKSATDDTITFSDFDDANFVLNAEEWISDGSKIGINIDGMIDWVKWTYASGIINVVKWYLDIYQNNKLIEYNQNKDGIYNWDKIEITLPATDEYLYKDDFNLTQSNLDTIPKITLKLVDKDGEKINIESISQITSKNGLILPGNIETRSVTKTQNNMTFDVTQNRFKSDSNHIIKSGEAIVYLMPNFKAGKDILYISMPWIDDIEIPVEIHPAPASMIEIKTKKNEISTYSNTKWDLVIMDNWNNIINQNTAIKFWNIWPISISGFDSSSEILNIEHWIQNFEINSDEEWGVGFLYATIEWLDLNKQKPGYSEITVQKKILPENNLNIMYLNIFGSDWWNQWWYMSDNNKYIEKLINNSEKLLAATTQLVSTDKIKKYNVIFNDKIQIDNSEDAEVILNLNKWSNTENSDDNVYLNINIDNIWEYNIAANSFQLQEINVSKENTETVIESMIENKFDNNNVVFYLPEDTDSIIESNEVDNDSILINNENIFDLNKWNTANLLNIKLSKDSLAGMQIWNLSMWDKSIWRFLISVNNQDNINKYITVENSKYDYGEIWVDGSTQDTWIWFYEIESSLPDNTLWYKSIQDSIDSKLWIGFVNDFKNITNFGAGEPVGQATIPFGSEFLINIGDPLIKRINENETAKIYDKDGNIDEDSLFDKWLWKVIYSEPWKTILKVINIDFNNDWLEDIIVAFTDGTIKILKNYGWNNPYQQIWDLMVLADGIKKIIIWDVDGNGYEDIIIWSRSDQLRVYKNNEWVFDVDGYPICLNTDVKNGMISDTPENIWNIFQIFFEDMDQDGKMDIITNDQLGFIKIFYGGKNNIFDEDNYVSNSKFSCDDNRYARQSYQDNTQMVYRFGIKIDEDIKVLDQSLIHWEWINPDEDVNISAQELWVDTDLFEWDLDENNLEVLLDQSMNFDTKNAIQSYRGSERYKQANFWKIPVYEDVENENDLEYVEIWCLTWEDPSKIYKQYRDINGWILENGDKVEVTINIQANDNFVWTFIDNIRWPWIIPLTGDNDMIENFWFEEWVDQDMIDNELIFHWDMVNSRYMIDNINMDEGQDIVIKYWVYYDGDVQTNKIEIQDIDGKDYERWANWERWDFLSEYELDDYPDIKIKPSDGCNKSMFVLFNEDQDKNYAPEYIDLTELLMDYSSDNQSNYDNTMSDINNTLANTATSTEEPNFDNIPWLSNMLESWSSMDILWDTFDIDNMLSQWWIDLSSITNAPMQLIDSLLWDVMDKVDDLMWGMCNGFDLSKMGIWWSENCGLPVPFNEAFLWPGNYHLFGCFDIPPLTETLGKGWPVLNIPGNWPGPSGYLPIPGLFGFPFRWPTDGFLGWPKSWPYPSQFRLYLVPTLTAEIWIAMCFGPYSVWTAIPDPFSSIGGNCVVTSIPLPCKNAGITNPGATNQIPNAYLDLETCSNQNVPCFVWEWESTSSFELVSSNSTSANITAAIPDGSYAGGFINIEKEPVTEHGYNTPESGIEINGIRLIWGADSKNKTLGWQAKWLIKSVSKMRMDKQIKYITSNLTNFKVDVFWPDFAGIMWWMWQWWITGALVDAEKNELSDEQKCENRWRERKSDTEICEKKISPNQNEEALWKIDTWAQNNLLDREQITNISNTAYGNPFKKLEVMFQDVPLINIRTENINVKIPMLSSEDISAYTHMSKNWIDKQKKVLKDWKDFLGAMLGICGGRTDISSMQDLKDAYYELKEQLREELKNEVDGIENQIKEKTAQLGNLVWQEKENAEQEIKQLKEASSNAKKSNIKKIWAIDDLNSKYDLNALGDYSVFESCEGWDILIRAGNWSFDNIINDDVYISYNNWSEQELEMVTKGFDLLDWGENLNGKKIIEYQRNNQNISNANICLKTFSQWEKNQCIDLFLGGKFDATLNDFLNIQTSSDQLITSVKQNLETLELYKQFPLDLYEWIHVGDRYMAEISSVINNFWGTISLWMKTNATRYSQYVDSLILIMTTIQTYQAIIDLSVNWSDRCSSCTNDNYDQFACKLGLLCPDNLPILKIPPMKIPSIYIDLSDINLETDVKLPKFNFIPTSIPLPSLPNLPNPPSIDISSDIWWVSAGVNVVKSLMIKLDQLDLSLNLPAIPVIPSPPDLPEIPSFIPSVKMELPVLPPAPKIPALPDEIQATIDVAETIWQILCIVKWNIWLVWEDSIKAKIEQMSQRTYEVPYWDNLDQTLAERKEKAKWKIWDLIPDWLGDTFDFLKSEEFSDVELKWFDIGIESHVNLQYNFEWFYSFVDQIVDEVNKVSSMPEDLMQAGVDRADGQSRELEDRMNACATTPISEACLWNAYSGEIKERKERMDELKEKMDTMWERIENWFAGVKEAKQIIANKENKENKTQEDLDELDDLYNTYGSTLDAYQNYIDTYTRIFDEYNEIKEYFSNKMDDLLWAVNEQISNADDWIDSATSFDKLKERNAKIQAEMDIFEEKQWIRREQRKSNLNGLYKEISYMEYDEDVYNKNMNILKNSLDKIQSRSDDAAFKKKIDSYVKLANIDNNISPATNNINNVINQYNAIIGNFEIDRNTLAETIWWDYDKFLYAVAKNDKRLVWNDDINISLSSKLFDIDQNSLDVLKKQENVNKTYLDYERKNIDGYIWALENNSPADLNMNAIEYNQNKNYMYQLKEKSDIAYDILDGKNTSDKQILIAQSNWNESNSTSDWSSNTSYTDISSYIDGKVIKTFEWSFDLANDEYVQNFQGKSLLVDINNDDENDLILWDQNNVYIKYRDNNTNHENIDYRDNLYEYRIDSYKDLLDNSEEWFVKIKDIYVKLCDENWEIKNFRYNGGDFDSIKVKWMNSISLWDKPKWYLVKMIHRVDLFNDKEIIVSNDNDELFDKKYVLVLPIGAPFTGTKISLEEWTYRTEDIMSGLIFDMMYYSENQKEIDLTIQKIPRNWQYSEIYTLDLYKDNLYFINSSSSNQVVAGPQIIADSKWPEPIINLYRPAIDKVIYTGEHAEGYVSTNYILKANWEDNVAIDKLWIADGNGDILKLSEDLNQKTWYIELDWLFFTGAWSMNYYFGATDTNDNNEVTQVNLNIKVPKINIIDIQKYGEDIDSTDSPATITAEIEHGIDEWFVSFDRYRNEKRETITGSIWWVERDKYSIDIDQTIITWWYYDFGNDIGLYLKNGDLAAKIDPDTGKIWILDWFEEQVSLELGYNTHSPMVTLREKLGNVLFSILLPSKKLIDIHIPSLEVQDLDWDVFGDFNGWKAIIKNNEAWIYVSPKWEIYTEWNVYGDYSFDEDSETVKYSIKENPNGDDLGYIEVKVKNLLSKLWE